MDWALRYIFVAYVERLKDSARNAYEVDVLVWAIFAAGGSKFLKPDTAWILGARKIVIGG